uniref:Uncharacterized protein n=1 Tax=Anguilla anguilla TaxID=7936 RepID=A0A0E9Q9D3_ANGAN
MNVRRLFSSASSTTHTPGKHAIGAPHLHMRIASHIGSGMQFRTSGFYVQTLGKIYLSLSPAGMVLMTLLSGLVKAV